MDYSFSSDEIGEPEEINESFESVEPEFTENIQETDFTNNIPTEQVDSKPTDLQPKDIKSNDTNVTFHAQPNGIEVPSSPDTEPLDRPSIRDFGLHGGGPEGRY